MSPLSGWSVNHFYQEASIFRGQNMIYILKACQKHVWLIGLWVVFEKGISTTLIKQHATSSTKSLVELYTQTPQKLCRKINFNNQTLTFFSLQSATSNLSLNYYTCISAASHISPTYNGKKLSILERVIEFKLTLKCHANGRH